ncbi:type IV toxin-antitoxin system AbiEi family antitoxin domain-containing protein [Pseudactinotalea sp.]|uniref:type IV toxin-antitoxin system AbiEi family antitoxin domain-containing protein n=1 Tax=Pseudactinotalea sp. TaxID=1926260 RepID=UPI003B3A0DB4
MVHPHDARQLRALLQQQDGVVARRQLLDLGLQDHDIRRLVRRRELAVAHPGVYVHHTGPLTYRQRQWVAILTAWPAALTGAAALPELRAATIDLVITHGRTLRLPPGVRARRLVDTDDVQWHRSPPRVTDEHAIVDVMSDYIAAGDVPSAYHALTRVAHGRRTTAQHILASLDKRTRVRGRALIRQLLLDLRDGAHSVLERQYLHAVERAHGLPRASRQAVSRATGRRTDSDIRYDQFNLIVELDGAAFHQGARRDDDADRDLAHVASSETATVRVTHGLVFTYTCRTAARIAAILQRRGWRGTPRRCRHCPPATQHG